MWSLASNNGTVDEMTTRFVLNPKAFGSSSEPFEISNSAGHFRITSTGKIQVRDGFTWLPAGATSYVRQNTWHTFTVINDFKTATWRLWVDGVRVGGTYALFENYRRPVDLTISQFGGNASSAVDNILITAGSSPPLSPNFPRIQSVSSEPNSSALAVNLIDGDTTTKWTASGFPQNVVIDFGSTQPISGTRLWTDQNRPYQYRIETSDSPTSGFSLLVDRTGNTSGSQPLSDDFPAKFGRYVRITVTGVSGGGTQSIDLTEFALVLDRSVLYSQGFEESENFSNLNRVPNVR